VRSLGHPQDPFLLEAPAAAAVLAPELGAAVGLRLREQLPLAQAVGAAARRRQARRLRVQAFPGLGAFAGAVPGGPLLRVVGAGDEVLVFLHQLQEDVRRAGGALGSVGGLHRGPKLLASQRSMSSSAGAGGQQEAGGLRTLPQGNAAPIRLVPVCRAGPLAAGGRDAAGVRPAVPEEVSLLAEALPALGAAERPLAGVGSLVNGQVHLLPESLPALGAGMRSLTGVALPVQLQLPVLLEGLPAERAGVGAPGVARQAGGLARLARGSLGSVHTLVDPQGELALEALGTLEAGEGLPAGVGLLVGDEVGLLGEAFAALGAGEGALTRVRAVVGDQVPLLVEAAAADAAGEGPLAGVDALVGHQVGLQAEPLPADIAAVGPSAPVVLPVLRQALVLGKAPPTLGAHPGPPLRRLLLGTLGGQLVAGALLVLGARVGLLPDVGLLVGDQGEPEAEAVAALVTDEGFLHPGGRGSWGGHVPQRRLHPQLPQEVRAVAEGRGACAGRLSGRAVLRPEQGHLLAKPLAALDAGEGLLAQGGLLVRQERLLRGEALLRTRVQLLALGDLLNGQRRQGGEGGLLLGARGLEQGGGSPVGQAGGRAASRAASLARGVGLLVGFEGDFVLEALLALAAGVGPQVRVGALVGHQVGFLGEALAALGAGEGALARVHAVVGDQVGLLVEAPAAEEAGEGPLAGVDPSVGDEVGLLPEALPTLGADEGGVLLVAALL